MEGYEMKVITGYSNEAPDLIAKAKEYADVMLDNEDAPMIAMIASGKDDKGYPLYAIPMNAPQEVVDAAVRGVIKKVNGDSFVVVARASLLDAREIADDVKLKIATGELDLHDQSKKSSVIHIEFGTRDGKHQSLDAQVLHKKDGKQVRTEFEDHSDESLHAGGLFEDMFEFTGEIVDLKKTNDLEQGLGGVHSLFDDNMTTT